MSLVSSFLGKIPVVGGLLNDVGKVLPSGGQLIGSVAGPVGGIIGGAIDGNTTPLQKNIQGGVDAAAAGLGIAGLAGAGPAAAGTVGGDAAGTATAGAAAGGSSIIDQALAAAKLGGGALLDFLKNHGGDLLQAANIANAAYNQTKASDYANKAYNTANDAYNAKAPLRTAGIAGMLNPSANTPDLSSLKSIAGPNSGNPFAPKGLPVAGMPGTPTPSVNGAPPGPVMMPGGSATAPTPLPIQRPPMTGAIPRLPVQ